NEPRESCRLSPRPGRHRLHREQECSDRVPVGAGSKRSAADFPQDTNQVVLERAGAFDSDRWDSTSFSVAEGAIGGDANAPLTAMICCWHESPSAISRSNAPPAQS